MKESEDRQAIDEIIDHVVELERSVAADAGLTDRVMSALGSVPVRRLPFHEKMLHAVAAAACIAALLLGYYLGRSYTETTQNTTYNGISIDDRSLEKMNMITGQ